MLHAWGRQIKHVAQAYFNGVHIPGLLSLRTLIGKLVSATFVLAAGLIAEGEAPFVHIGTIVGGGLTAAGSRHTSPMLKCCENRAHIIHACVQIQEQLNTCSPLFLRRR